MTKNTRGITIRFSDDDGWHGEGIILSVTYHGKIKTLLLKLGERAHRSHLVRLETLRARACVVHLYHARANIDADELGDVRRERTRDLAYIHTKNKQRRTIYSLSKHHADRRRRTDTYPIHKRNPALRWRLRLGLVRENRCCCWCCCCCS